MGYTQPKFLVFYVFFCHFTKSLLDFHGMNMVKWCKMMIIKKCQRAMTFSLLQQARPIAQASEGGSRPLILQCTVAPFGCPRIVTFFFCIHDSSCILSVLGDDFSTVFSKSFSNERSHCWAQKVQQWWSIRTTRNCHQANAWQAWPVTCASEKSERMAWDRKI